MIQTNDVDLDYRGLIYITDRAGNGLHVLEFTGIKIEAYLFFKFIERNLPTSLYFLP